MRHEFTLTMATRAKHVLKESFEIKSKIESFFIGNKIACINDGEHIYCPYGSVIKILNVKSGRVINEIKSSDDNDIIITFAVNFNGDSIVVAHQSGLLRLWSLKDITLLRTWKSTHNGPIAIITFDDTSTFVATGGSDSSIKVWDVIRHYCTHNLKGANGVFSAVLFSRIHSEECYHIYGAADDCSIHIWDLIKSKHIGKLEGHCGRITDIKLSYDNKYILSGSRDKIVIVWDAKSYEKIRAIPVFESVESLIIIPENKSLSFIDAKHSSNKLFITGGDLGILRVWDFHGGTLLYKQNNPFVSGINDEIKTDESGNQMITQTIYNDTTDEIIVVSFEKNIIFYKLNDFSLIRQFIGNADEIFDMKLLGENESHIAIATNSPNIKIYEISSLSCSIIKGHTDIVMSLDTFASDKCCLISASKDNSIRLWRFSPETMQVMYSFRGCGHSHSVTSVAAPYIVKNFFVSVSEDTTLKIWKIPQNIESDLNNSLHVKNTLRVHEKIVNAVTISPNDMLIATASQDKTAKIWTVDMKLLGVLMGHRRGIWSLLFSPVDQVIATASADATIKLWELKDFTCLKTFQGHDCSVLKVLFVDRGMQLISCASDGNVKIWNLKQNECVKTIDAHNDKIWALTKSNSEELLFTAGSDSTIKIWRDITKDEKEETAKKHESNVIADQSLANLIEKKQWSKALKVAIRLNYPFRALNILKEILVNSMGTDGVNEVLMNLKKDEILVLFNYANVWNTNSKHFIVSQCILNTILRKFPPQELLKITEFKQKIESLIPYTERHLNRLNRMQQQVTFADFVWENMKLSEMPNQKINVNVEANIENETDSNLKNIAADTEFVITTDESID